MKRRKKRRASSSYLIKHTALIMKDLRNARLTSKGFYDVPEGAHFFDRAGGYPARGDECIKTGEHTSRRIEDGKERTWERNTSVYVAAKCKRLLKEGERVRITRTTSRPLDSSRSVITGEETFDGVVDKVSSDTNTAWVRGDQGQHQVTSKYEGDEHGSPVVRVEVIKTA